MTPRLHPWEALADGGAATPVGGYLQIEFRMSLEAVAPGEDFWTAIFNVELGPGLENNSGWLDPATAQANGYYPVAPSLAQFDSNGATAGGVQFHWQFGNADFGVDPNDLLAVIVEASSAEAANRQYGEATRPGAGFPDGLGSPTLLGTLIVKRTGLEPTSITVAPIAGSPWGLYTDNTAGDGTATSQPNSAFAGGTLGIAVPEPGGLSLAILASALLWYRRRVGFRGAFRWRNLSPVESLCEKQPPTRGIGKSPGQLAAIAPQSTINLDSNRIEVT